jgi:hypothetical protein
MPARAVVPPSGRAVRVEKAGIMKPGLKVAGAIGVGYLLGRRHKMRMALTLGAAAAAGQLGHARDVLKEQTTEKLTSSETMGTLADPGKRLLDAGKSAAVAAVANRIGTLSDQLEERAEAVRHPGGDGEGPEAEAEEPESKESKARKDEGEESEGEASKTKAKKTEAKESKTKESKDSETKKTKAEKAEGDEENEEPKAKKKAGGKDTAAADAPVRRKGK